MMGIFADFRDVFKELKHKNRGETVIKLCPKCGSPKISFCSGFDAYPQLYGIIPGKYFCEECGYKGPIVLEEKKDETG